MLDAMFFFEEKWRQYADALGLQQMCDDLKRKGYGHEWPMKVYGPEDGAEFHPGGGKFHPSKCPHYEGFWWAGGFGAVQCSAIGELLPGAVYERMCRKGHEECPLRGKELQNGNVGQKVKFDPFQHIGGYGACDLRGKQVTGTVVEVHEDHGWFSVKYGENGARTSFVFNDIGKDVKILK